MSGIELIFTWNSEAFSCVPSPRVKKPYLDQLKFLSLIGTSCEPEVTAQELGARKRKLREDFTGIQFAAACMEEKRGIMFFSFFCYCGPKRGPQP